jgi:hypothetical protein
VVPWVNRNDRQLAAHQVGHTAAGGETLPAP